MDTLVAAVGRLHNLTLHFPIALVFAVAFIELLLARRIAPERRDEVVRWLLILTAVSGVIAGVSGLAYAADEGFRGEALLKVGQHRNAGMVTNALLVVTAVLWWKMPRTIASRVLLALGVVGVTVTGHLGGELVHGAGYLTEPFSGEKGADDDDDGPAVASDGEEVEVKQRERHPEGAVPDVVDYATHIKPLFDRSCNKCHGPEKRKSGLRLDKKRFAMKGGESGPAIEPGKPDESLVVKYVTLAPDDEDIMPPKGKLLSMSEIETLRKWIAAGAPWPDDGDGAK